MRVAIHKDYAIAINDFNEVAVIEKDTYNLLVREIVRRGQVSRKRETTLAAEIVANWAREMLDWA